MKNIYNKYNILLNLVIRYQWHDERTFYKNFWCADTEFTNKVLFEFRDKLTWVNDNNQIFEMHETIISLETDS